MIPEPKNMTLDVDTKDGLRRFFDVDIAARTAKYIPDFEKKALKPPPALTADLAQAAFDQLWEVFDRKYAMFTLRPEVNWAKLRVEYRPKALASKSTLEFAEVCAEMLEPLHDLHVWLTVADENLPVFNRLRAANSNPSAHEAILGALHHQGHDVQWAVTSDKIGFIAISGWNGPDVSDQCQAALEQMRDTRGLIIDVRLNGGGSEDQAGEFAGRFLKQKFVYAYSQFRNGPNHTNLTQKFQRIVAPTGPWQYDRPVVLLIGQKCMSSNESFIGMMSGDPDVLIMGDHTCGSSGNPEIINLPLEMTVSVPLWIDYLPDGTPLDERGFQPQIPFVPTPGAFDGKRDDLLTAALVRLRQAPLPDKRVTGSAFVSSPEAEAQDDSRPMVVSVFPSDGAESVEPVSELRVRFDRPMNPFSSKLDWESGGFKDVEFPRYDPEKHEFSIPVHLGSGTSHQVVVNDASGFGGNLGKTRSDYPRDGFQSPDHHLARRFAWKFMTRDAASVRANANPTQTSESLPSLGRQVPVPTSPEVQSDKSLKPQKPQLLEILEFMQKQRAKMISINEQVQTLTMSRQKKDLFTSLTAQSAVFKWQQPDRYYADVADIMLMGNIFAIGCDGQNWWCCTDSTHITNIVVCPEKEMQQLNISLCDPFGLTRKTVEQAACKPALNYVGETRLGNADCHLIERGRTQWWIDANTGRPLAIRQPYNDFITRTRFLYAPASQILSPKDFAIPKIDGLLPAMEPLSAGYTNRFINLRDGSDNNMSVRWGKKGPAGSSSSGLN